MATHSSILARKSPWTEEPGRLQSMGLHDWACVHEGGGSRVCSNKLVELKKKKKNIQLIYVIFEYILTLVSLRYKHLLFVFQMIILICLFPNQTGSLETSVFFLSYNNSKGVNMFYLVGLCMSFQGFPGSSVVEESGC